MLHPDRAVSRLEDEAEQGGANQDEHHKARQLGGRSQGLLEQLQIEALAHPTHDQGTYCAHGTAFGGCGHAQEDRAQHQENQQQRWNEHKGHAFGQAREQTQTGGFVEQSNDEGDKHTATHGHHHFFIGSHAGDFLTLPPAVNCLHMLRQENRYASRQCCQHGQRGVAAAAVGLTVGAGLGWQCWYAFRLENGQCHHVRHVQAHQHEPW